MGKIFTLGIDLGGTHLSCGLVDEAGLEISQQSISRNSYDNTQNADVILGIWSEIILKSLAYLEPTDELKGIGFAVPGPFDYSNGVSKMTHKMAALFDAHIPTELNKVLGKDLDMRFINDASCFAIGEAIKGEGKDIKKVVVITLGTGFGSAFIDDTIPIVDRSDVPEEGCLWHLPFKEGIADDYFSTGWFVGAYENRTGEKVKGVKEILHKNPKIVNEIFEEFADNLSTCLSPTLKAFDAEILIIGGNISKAISLFIDPLIENFKSHHLNIQISASQLMENAAIIGSAHLFNEQYWERVSKVLPSL